MPLFRAARVDRAAAHRARATRWDGPARRGRAARVDRAVRWGAALAIPLVACAATPTHPDLAAAQPEVLVEVLPGRAELRVDGRLVGRGGCVLAVPDPAHTYRIAASAPGFDPAERAERGAQLDGARIGLVLRPAGMPGTREIDPDDAQALASAAEVLLGRGEDSAAGEYARRAVALAPNLAAARRVLDAVGARDERGIEVRHGRDGSTR